MSRFWGRYGGAHPLWEALTDRATYLLKAAAAIYFVRSECLEMTVCVGVSMMPTFNPRGDVALSERFSVTLCRVQPGDIVLARSTHDPRHMVIKRVLGLEGDTVYVPSSTKLGLGRTVTVPRGHVWLQGDNFNTSTDSRHYGPVPYAMLRGRVFVKIWPPSEAGAVKNWLPPWQEEEFERQRLQRARDEEERAATAAAAAARQPPPPR